MERAISITPDDLDFFLKLSVEDRLRQANAAFRLYHELHRPYARPFHRGVDRIEDLGKPVGEETVSR